MRILEVHILDMYALDLRVPVTPATSGNSICCSVGMVINAPGLRHVQSMYL